MDIRIARTDRAIEKAFMELRAKNPLEKIKIKDLCALACINKSTFYAHYEDIYALSSGLETKVIGNILACVTDFGPNRPLDHTEELTQGLFRAFVQNQRAVNILFSGSRQGVFANSIEQGLRKRVAELDPTFTAASSSRSACRAASTPLPTTAAGWTRPSSWPCWPRSPKQPRRSSCDFEKKQKNPSGIARRIFCFPFVSFIIRPKRRSLPARGQRGR